MTHDQARKIAEAIFDDIERERLFSLDRVADVIERTARMEQTTLHLSGPAYDRFVAELDRESEPTEALVALYRKSPPWKPSQTIIQPDD